MTPLEQRDKLLKLKDEYIDLMVKEANRSFGIAYAHGYTADPADVAEGERIRGEMEAIEADIASESAAFPRAQLIRRAKALIAALGLPEGGGVAMGVNGRWMWFDRLPGNPLWSPGWDVMTRWGLLPTNTLPDHPGDWKDSWITMDTREE